MKFQHLVLPNGSLNKEKIDRKELLHQGIYGQRIERIYVENTSFILKALPSVQKFEQELWINHQILKDFPPIYPKLLFFSKGVEVHWLIYEDLGRIEHKFDKELVLNIVRSIAWWHQYPVHKLKQKQLSSEKPSIFDMIKEISNNKRLIMNLLKDGAARTKAEKLIQIVNNKEDLFIYKNLVLSHGDLHLGNYGKSQKGVVVIDWEYVHLNLVYWDLYYLIDSTHPNYPKNLDPNMREEVLDSYLHLTTNKNHERFKWEYYIFAAIFSFWMLTLIEKDIQNIKQIIWTKDQLLRQKEETISIIEQLLKKLY